MQAWTNDLHCTPPSLPPISLSLLYKSIFSSSSHQVDGVTHRVQQYQFTCWATLFFPSSHQCPHFLTFCVMCSRRQIPCRKSSDYSYMTHEFTVVYTIPEKPWSLPHFHPHSKSLVPSGIFCSLYYCVEWLRLERMVDVFRAVQRMQLQRPGMVESVQQYTFIYDCMFEFIRTYSDSQ